MALTTISRVRKACGLDALTGDEVTALRDVLIPDAQAELESLLHRTFTEQSFDEDYLLDRGQREVHLRHAPVADVATLTLSSYPPTAASSLHEAISDLDFIVRVWGIQLIGFLGTTIPTSMNIVYTAGVGADTSAWLAASAVLTRRVARDLLVLQRLRAQDAASQNGIKSLSVEGYAVAYETAADLGLAPNDPDARGGFSSLEWRSLQRLRRPVVR